MGSRFNAQNWCIVKTETLICLRHGIVTSLGLACKCFKQIVRYFCHACSTKHKTGRVCLDNAYRWKLKTENAIAK